jgi:outer membrane protein TolC
MRLTALRLTCLGAALALALPAAAEEATEPPRPAARLLTLAEAQEMAARRNPSLKNVGELVYQADTTIRFAWSMLLPNVNARGSLVLNEDEISLDFPDFSQFDPTNPGAPMPTESMVIQEKWGKSFGFSANMTLFNPRSIPLIMNAYDNADLSRLTAKRMRNELLFAVTSSYYHVHSKKEMVLAWQENLKIAEEFHRQAEARLGAGQSTEIDVKRAEIQEIDAAKGLANAEDGVEMAKTALAYLIGMEGDFEIAGPEQVAAVEGDLTSLQDRALKDRVDIAEAATAKKMAERSKTETWMKWLPSFDVTYDWSWNSAEGFAGENDVWMLIFGAKWSLLEGGGRIAEAQTRESEIRMRANDQAQLTLDIRQQVEQSYLDVNKRQRNVEMAEKQVALAEENHELLSRQYEVGLATSLDLLTAGTEVATKRISQVIERLQYDIALLALRKAVGEYHSLAAVEARD